MSLLVYVTPECESDARQHGVQDKLHAFVDRVERAQDTHLFDRFPPPFLTRKKIFDFNYRLIASEHKVHNHFVVCLLRFLVRSSAEYENFQAAPQQNGAQFLRLVPDLGPVVEARVRRSAPVELPSPDPEEAKFLWTSLGGLGDYASDTFVCETAEWARAVAQPKLDARLIAFPDAIKSLVDAEEQEDLRRVPAYPDVAILFRNFPQHKKLLLLSAFHQPSEDQLAAARAHHAERIGAAPTPEDLLRVSVRAYPHLLCYDPDLWRAVEKDEAANLALSPEEAELLRSVHLGTGAASGYGFPLFINGRAGSGKSTILQYLFADYLRAWLQSFGRAERTRRPAYFACGKGLVQHAERVVRNLLTANSNFLIGESPGTRTAIAAEVGSMLHVFHDYLRDLLEAPVRERKFPISNYVDYPKFKALWKAKFAREKSAARDHGPQVSWHVIRSYIKGYSVDGEIGPPEYQELPRDEMTVSREKFAHIHEVVWYRWYRGLCEERRVWDDQDLVRHLLDRELVQPSFCGLFCDEAQDFTRVEIEALYRMSLYSARSLKPEDAGRVPFVFAGDPFQTLNPTGFRWEAIRAGFTQKISYSLHRFRERQDIPEINFRELTFNYRSTRNIVRLCNSIQALRAARFRIPSLRPQSAWQHEPLSPMPVYYPLSEPNLTGWIREQNDLVIIVPCEEGEESEFVKGDPFLLGAVRIDPDSGTPQNVLSPSRAKGLEFNRVLLYGFGARAEEFAPAKRGKGGVEGVAETRETDLPMEYFLNGLYVAASRPRRCLFVVDTEAGLDGLWHFATEEGELTRVLQELPRGGADWVNDVGLLARGTRDHWAGEQEDPRKMAGAFEEEARRKQDGYLYQQAAFAYENAGIPGDACRCRAWARYCDRDYAGSARLFREAGDAEHALEALWTGELYREIGALALEYERLAARPECRAAGLASLAEPSLADLSSLLEDLARQAGRDAELSARLAGSAWARAINRLLRQVVGVSVLEGEAACRRLAKAMDTLATMGVALDGDAEAPVLYRAGEFERAVATWEGNNDRSSLLYREAKVQLVLARRAAGQDQFSPDETRYMVEHARKYHLHAVAVEWCEMAGDAAGVESGLMELLADDNSSAADLAAATRSWWRLAVAKGRWQEAIDLAQSGSLKKLPDPQRQRLLGLVRQQSLNLIDFIPELARSERLRAESSPAKRLVTDYLRREIFVEHAAWQAWKRVLHPEVAGAAVERAGKDIDALEFYERIMRDPTSPPALIRRARLRWITCKLRQSQREADGNLRERAEEHRAEAERNALALGIDIATLGTDYPDLSNLVELPQASARTESGGISTPDQIRSALPDVAVQDTGGRATMVGATTEAPSSEKGAESTTSAAPAVGTGKEPLVATPQPVSIVGQTVAQQPEPTVPRRPAEELGPSVGAPAATAKSGGPCERQLGTLKVRFFPLRGRINVEGSDGSLACIKLADGQVESTDLEIRPRGSGRFFLPAWALEVAFGLGGNRSVRLAIAEPEGVPSLEFGLDGNDHNE